jgi:hypothetical protein
VDRPTPVLNHQRPASSPPSWLPEFARHLGGHAAPSGSTNSTFIAAHELPQSVRGEQLAGGDVVLAGVMAADGTDPAGVRTKRDIGDRATGRIDVSRPQ